MLIILRKNTKCLQIDTIWKGKLYCLIGLLPEMIFLVDPNYKCFVSIHENPPSDLKKKSTSLRFKGL